MSAALGDTVNAIATAKMLEAMKPITGTKSKTPAISASSSAAGTFSTDSRTSTNTDAMTDVSTLPAT